MDSVMADMLAIIPINYPLQGVSRYPIFLICFFYNVNLPFFNYLERSAILFADIWQKASRLICLHNLIYSSYADMGYLSCLICCPTIILSSYGLHKLPSGEFHALSKLTVGK